MAIHQSVKYTLLHSIRPAIRDRVVRVYFPIVDASASTSTATTMMTSTGQAAMQKAAKTRTYRAKPEECAHPDGLRQYSAGLAGTLQICDRCGSRWQKVKATGEWKPVEPKTAPDVDTPITAKPKANATPTKLSSSSSRASPASSAPAASATRWQRHRTPTEQRTTEEPYETPTEEADEDKEMIPVLPETWDIHSVQDTETCTDTETSWSIPPSSRPRSSIDEVLEDEDL